MDNTGISSQQPSRGDSVKSNGSSAFSGSADTTAQSRTSWGRGSDGRDTNRRREKERESEREDANHLTVFRRRARRSGGFLMGNMFKAETEKENNTISSPSKASPVKSSPGRSSPHRSRLGQTTLSPDQMDGSYTSQPRAPSSYTSQPRDPSSATPSLDPTQLVQMALSLSEGRRRHASANLAVPNGSVDSRRIRSAGATVITVAPGSPMGNDFMTETRASSDHDRIYASIEEIDYHFSPATLQRAERARNFFELSSEYRRLLTHLPPLNPNPTAPTEYRFPAKPSSHEKCEKNELGREYNPLQLLRNRKARHREQRPLDPAQDAFDDVSRVKSYIDNVESEASDATYRISMDVSLLPSFLQASHSQESAPKVTASHRRSDTAVSKIIRHENDWSFTPSELLADTVWLLQGDNKSCVEDRHGHKISPQPPRSSFESSRSGSKNGKKSGSKNGRRSGESRPSMTRTNTWASQVKTDDEHHERGRKKPKFLSLHHVDKHMFRNRSRSSSMSSITSSTNKRLLGPGTALDNTAPLKRHMEKLIEMESLHVQKQSPELVSPDRWDRPQDVPAVQHIANSSAGSHHEITSNKTEEHPQTHKHDRPRSSFDSSTAPSSPAVANHIPSFGMSLSPPQSRHSSPERKFGIFKSTKDRTFDNIGRTDFAAQSNSSLTSSRHVSDNVDPPRSSFESFRPNGVKRHRTTNSISNALFSSGRRMSKDVGVGRFFKSGRISDLVRTDSTRHSDNRKSERHTTDASSVSTISDDEDDILKRPPVTKSNSTAVAATPKEKEKEKQRYHIPNLPSFTSRDQAAAADDLSSVTSDPIARQNKLRRGESRTRFDRLAPPRINLPHNDSDFSFTATRTGSPNSSDDEGPCGLDTLTPLRKNRSSAVGRQSRPQPSLSVSNSPARQSSPGKRHWSISDRGQEKQVQQVSAVDIAHVKALYLSSGIKAYSICAMANSIKDPSSDFFLVAAKTAKEGDHPVTVREEFTVAARLLSRTIASKTSSLESSLSSFRSKRISQLHSRLDDLRHKVDEKFTPLVHSTADEAEAFTVELTTQHTLAVKQVNDAIDTMLRQRRRNLIFLQRACFTLLEWILLGVMWCVWFVVVIIQSFRGVIVGIGTSVRWLLWL